MARREDTHCRSRDDAMKRPTDVIVLRTYDNELSARIAALSLEANGIPAQVSADTAGGALPNLAIAFPVRLLVRAADAELARHLLDTEAPSPPDDPPGA